MTLEMPPAAVLFDCDGVLVDSEGMTLDLLLKDFKNHGLPLSRKELDANFVGLTMPEVGRRARALGATLPDTWADEFYERLYALLATGTPLIDGVPELLEKLEAANIPFAIGSNGTQRKMRITLGQYPALRDKLEGRIFSGQDLERPKPAPDLYLHAAKALNVVPERCVVIEDSAAGAEAARRAGIHCMGYAAHDDGAKLKAQGAQVFHSMHNLPALLGI